MKLFDAFSPEAIFTALSNALTTKFGIDPAQMQSVVKEFVTEIQAIKAEREAFRVAAKQVVHHFNSELAAVREQLTRIERAMTPRLVTLERVDHDLGNGTGHDSGSGHDAGTSEQCSRVAGVRSGSA